MSRPVVLLAPLLLSGCPTASDGAPEDCDVLWERDVQGFFDNWCTPCHGSAVAPQWRQGAPVGLDFDDVWAVRAWAPQIAETSLWTEPRMPPAGGPVDAERAVVRRWMACGMPGTEAPAADRCVDPRAVDEASVGNQGEADALCASGDVAVTGTLTVRSGASADCVCRVDGDLSITGGAVVRLAQLVQVAGAVTVTDTPFDLPALRQIGGALTVSAAGANPGVGAPTTLTLPALQTVGSDVRVTDLGPVTRLELPWLREVGGAMVVASAPTLGGLSSPRLTAVGTDLRFEDLPALTDIETVQSLQLVPGALVITRTGVTALDDVRSYRQVGGAIEIRENPNLTSIDGFWTLTDAGALRIVDNPVLQAVEGFDLLTRVGELTVTGSSALEVLRVPLLGTVDTDVRLVDLPALTQLTVPRLVDVGGELVLDRAGALASVAELVGLRTVAADLTLSALGVTTLAPLRGVEQVGGHLTIRDNLALPTADAEALAAAIGSIGGDVIISGNAP